MPGLFCACKKSGSNDQQIHKLNLSNLPGKPSNLLFDNEWKDTAMC